jgi:very-short-patch-repair endonuclease
MKINEHKKEIINMYCNDKCSTYEIAEKFHTYPNKIRRFLKKEGVVLYDKAQAQENALKRGRSKIPTKGKKRSKEEKLKISSTLKKSWENIDPDKYNERVNTAKKIFNNKTELEKQEMRSAATKAIKQAAVEGSKLEKFLKYELSKEGYIIEIHKKDLIVNENLEIDMYFPELRTIIEIDGPSHFLPIWGEEKLKKQIKADQNKTGLILSKGLAIIRVKSLSDSVALSVKEELKNTLLVILESIKSNFPVKSKRYIEIEI